MSEKTALPADTLLRPGPVPENDVAVELAEYSWEEVLRHNRPRDLWLVVAGNIYNVGEFMFHHPGGAEVHLANHGHDATEAFLAAGHPEYALALTKSFLVGRLKEGSVPPEHRGGPDGGLGCPVAPSAAGGGTVPHDASSDSEVSRLDTGGPPDGEGAETPRRDDGTVEIPYAVRWLVPAGERFANFDVINDNDTQLDYYRRFGHVYAVGVPTKKWRLVVVSDPELLDEVASNEDQFGKKVEDINFFDQLGGSRGAGISVVGDSDYYERVRRIMLPWYAPAHQRTQFDRMMVLARKMIATWETIPSGEPLEMRDWMERYTLEVSGRGACNYDFNLLDKDAPKSPFAAAVPESTKESVARIAEPRPDFTLLSGPVKRARKRKYRTQADILFSTADALVRGRLNTCPAGEQTDLLTRLITTPDPDTGEHLDPETIRDQILMHLSNGFNGPSVIGAWLAYVLASHPDVEQNLIAEIDAVSDGDPDYDLQYADLMTLPYMTQVIKETLRIYPPMPITIRRSLKDGTLGPFRIRKDDIILVGALAAQRDERYWGPEADKFDPGQFAVEKVINRPLHAFIPFSVGPRQCMAQEVTFMMLRVALFEIYSHYRLELAPGTTVKKNTVATTKPAAVSVVLVPREGRDERQAALARRLSQATVDVGTEDEGLAAGDWDQPSDIPPTSQYRHLVAAFGSNFGTCRGLAETVVSRSRRYGFTHEALPLNELVDLPVQRDPWLLVVCTATYTGNPPSNANLFRAWLESTEAGCETWRNCRYVVWGLGNSQWNAFLRFPTYVHKRLGELGATPLAELGTADVGSPSWEQDFAQWEQRVWPVLIELSGAVPSDSAAARVAAEEASVEVAASFRPAGEASVSTDDEIIAPIIMTNAVGLDTTPVAVLAHRELQAPESPGRTRHLEVSLPSDIGYTAGDHLGICPQNDPDVVERLADHLEAPLDGVFLVPKTMNVRAVPKGVPLQVRNVLTCLVDITASPTVSMVELLLDQVTEPDERAKLQEIRSALSAPGSADSPLSAIITSGGYDVLSLLDEFPSCSLNLLQLLSVLQPLRPRYYSTCSSPRVHGPDVAHVSVGRLALPVAGRPEREFRGISSHYVHALREGDRVNVFLDRATGFHLQDDVEKPMVFVSAGTGYAPMRAFLWERLALQRDGVQLGRAILFNGIRHSSLDYIYRDEVEMFLESGVLDEAYVAASREYPGERRYVQDHIVERGTEVWGLIEQGAYVYTCGSATMRDGVRSAFVTVFTQHANMTPETAEAYMVGLESAENRYRPDVWS